VEATDPVCGMQVTVASPHSASHDGTTYRFCSAKCREIFLGDPTRYVGGRARSGAATGTAKVSAVPDEAATASGETIYTCPMHPQIRRNAPGNCPLCGMALEPVLTVAEEGNPELEDFTRRFRWTLPLTIAGVAVAMLGHRYLTLDPRATSWLELVLATPVVL
jgi:Cu+-exporting ATPase